MKGMGQLSTETDDSFSSLLDFAADSDVEAFRWTIELDLSAVDEAGPWYVRKKGSKCILQGKRTPLMVAATYGSVDVLKLIVALPEVDLNRVCGQEKWTDLHCAVCGGSDNAFDTVKLLLSAGANPNMEDACGRRPVDLIVVPPEIQGAEASLKDLLMNSNAQASVTASRASPTVLSSSPQCDSPSFDSLFSPTALQLSDIPANPVFENRQYPVDPSLPDIRNSIYSTDEFRMYSLKVRPCSRAYPHDWTECPFAHPGEIARRRDPRKYHYSCDPCPNFRKGACWRGDLCEYAHGVFECWLHPARYRTKVCGDGTRCAKKVCFFAHSAEELRPLYGCTGSGVPSPRSAISAASFMDIATVPSILPGSHSVTSPAFNNALLPEANGMNHSSAAWSQPNVPTLHLPGSNPQSSQLRSSLSARDVPPDLNMMHDFDSQQMLRNDMSSSPRSHPNSSMLNRTPLFAGQAGVFSPIHESAVLNQFQRPQSLLSPVNTNIFTPRNAEHHLLQPSFGVSSSRMSPGSLDTASPLNACRSAFTQLGKPQHMLHSFGANPVAWPDSSWAKWGSTIDWSSGPDDQAFLRRSKNDGDLAWGKESPPEMMEKSAPSSECSQSNSQVDSIDDSAIGTSLEQLQLDS